MRAFVIHGHFYQPFRENPYTGEILIEDSAFPFENWNERIYRECYLPNAYAHYREDGKTKRIINNYQHMSFNFGWTLLYWMEKNHPELLEKIKQASEKALAMSFNHTILPLDPDDDKLIQIRWGIRAFEHYFGRKPRGFWLPELAVDKRTLQILADEGIRYVVLAPHQVKGKGNLLRIRLQRGHMDAFVYDGRLSHEVSFGRILEDARRLLDVLYSKDGLTIIATDGETFGHHKKFGEMGLSYMFLHSPDFTTLEEYYSLHEPKAEGEVVEFTSWSCVHGIERWRSDCGCSTGGQEGWHQRWRKPLRDGLELIRSQIKEKVYNELEDFLKDPYSAVLDFVRVILGEDREDFAREHAKRELSKDEKIRVFKRLNAIKYIHLAFSSDGWFFADISGIETVKNLLFAKRAMELAGLERLEEDLREYLRGAESNLEDVKNGEVVWLTKVLPQVHPPQKVAKSVSLLERHGILGRDGRLGKWLFKVGEAVYLEDTETGEVYTFERSQEESFSDLPDLYAKRLYEKWVCDYIRTKRKHLQQHKEFLKRMLSQAKGFRSIYTEYVKEELSSLLKTELYTLIHEGAEWEEVEGVIKEGAHLSVDMLDPHTTMLMSAYMLEKIKQSDEEKVVHILRFVRELNAKAKGYESMIDLWEVQNYVWENRKGFKSREAFELLNLGV